LEPSRTFSTIASMTHRRVDAVQGPVLPLDHLPGDLLRDPGDRVSRDVRAVDVHEVRGDLTGRQPARRQRQDELVDAIQT